MFFTSQRRRQTTKSANQARRARFFQPRMEALEERLALAAAIWDGGSLVSADWTDAANWQGDVAPSPGDELFFVAGAPQTTNFNTFDPRTPFNLIAFSGHGWSVAGNAVLIPEGSAIKAAENTTAFVQLDVAVEAATLIASVEAGSTLTLAGSIAGDAGLTKAEGGTLILTAANTYTGETVVQAGTLNVRHSQALGSVDGGTTVQGESLLELQPPVVRGLQSSLSIEGESLTMQTTDGIIAVLIGIRNVGGNNVWTGGWNIEPTESPIIEPAGVPIVVEAGSTFAATGVLSGVGGLHKGGLGTLILSGANTYAGVTHVDEGILNIRHSQALGSAGSGTELMDGILELQGGINVQRESLLVHPYIEQENLIRNVSGANTWTGTWHFDPICPPIVTEPGSTLRMTGVLGGGGGIHKEGAGALILAGANTFDGPVHIEEGTLRLEHSLALGSTAGGTELMAGVLELQGGITVANETLEIVDGTSNTIRSVSGANTWTGAWAIEPTSSPNIEPTGCPIVVEAGSTFAASAVISGAGGLLKDGLGTFILSGANTYLGETRVAEGTLSVRSNTALGSTTGITELTGGTLELQGGITVAAETLDIVDGTSNIRSVSGVNTWTGGWIIEPTSSPIVVEAGSTFAASGVLSGVGGLHKDGLGTFVLSGANTYAGVTYVAEGVLNVRSNLALGSTAGNTEVFTGATLGLRDVITVTGEELVLHATSKLQSSGGSNTWTGTTRLLNDPPIEVEAGSVLELEGEIIGTENLEKLGAGTLIFSGDSLDYTGTLLVTEGTVLVNGNQPNSPVIVSEGGILGVSGLVGPVTFQGGTIQGALLQTSPLVPGQIDLVVGGTASNDAIAFSPASGGGIEVLFNGSSLGTYHPTGRVIAHAGAGDDDVQVAGNLTASAWLFGDGGHDRLKGGAGHDVLLGGDGDDLLIGGQGRDLLIGGIGADRIIGNADEDLLIAGFTDFDASDAALAAVLAEWTSARSYAIRRANLTSGSGSANRLNGSYFLDGQTVHDDADTDVLTGGSGADWFFADLSRDKVTDW